MTLLCHFIQITWHGLP